MDNQRLRFLLDRYKKQTINPQEFEELDNWFHQIDNQQTGFDSWVKEFDSEEKMANVLYNDFAIQLKRKTKPIHLWPRIVAAASVILCLSAGAYFLLRHNTERQIARTPKYDFSPGANKAVLILANGVNVNLTNANNGNVATQGNVKVVKTGNGQLTYHANGAPVSDALYNTVKTPRGGQYDLTLADGTKVWLNAASSITYPATFSGNSREVTITGEAYFEVSRNKHLPFLVHSGGQTVEVLGTHFNVNAYNDEDGIKTTLLEGSVKVSSGSVGKMIVPGQQVRFKNGAFQVGSADTEAAIAWKNGLFEYNHADIQTVMRAFGRWYDVDIEYHGKIPERSFNVDIHRDVKASQALKILEYLKIRYYTEKNKIVITNQE